ncbi:glycosyltransferase [Dermatophilus congolensis]|uniref:glycosyltransferase n=1 Tax=Dermatophilus congolensis TaxID=1863 RepID=UPI001AB003F1|nr:glycosyltransferase [Dermatophilus congolensis]MBO3142035.1 glycosyltransferase [Dermatophilus congolensis]MBO3151027.1 glycosyltransferase [Dermatophilus congolensis]MBO3161969.1 glycosyltransferase [Dermatophilus congolensis]MBO3162312.1 glycosyltransferase [Dermatophilus congolensis]MBO3175866.1 glycosyltransferase [Dermatophilus congolensis]
MTPRHVIVAIPAHNEQDHLPRCLTHLTKATTQAHTHTGTTCTTVIALDGCTDATPTIAHSYGALTTTLNAHNVGAARHSAICTAIATLDPNLLAAPEHIWIANTDADTLVPPHWIRAQLILASNGADLITGTVEPTPHTNPTLLNTWHAQHNLTETHPYIHGANLGIRASTYLHIGGFPAITLHEDITLVEHARTAGANIISTDTTRVRTSSRLHSNVEAGFAGYLRNITTS